MSDYLSAESLHFILRIGVAAIGGLCIGLEREIKGKDAGLRTNMLVAMGAALYALVALNFKGSTDADFLRVIGQVVTGVGFLCAGVIIQEKDRVKGLRTSATVWCSAGIGCLSASSMFMEVVLFVLLVVLVNVGFGLISIGKSIGK